MASAEKTLQTFSYSYNQQKQATNIRRGPLMPYEVSPRHRLGGDFTREWLFLLDIYFEVYWFDRDAKATSPVRTHGSSELGISVLS